MKQVESTVTSKGQVTIPAAVRAHLGLKKKDKVIFNIEPDGTVRLSVPRYPTVDSLTGAAGKLERPLTWKEMLEIAREDQVKEYLARRDASGNE